MHGQQNIKCEQLVAMCDTEQFGVAAIPQTNVPEIPHSNLCQDTGCPETFPVFSSAVYSRN